MRTIRAKFRCLSIERRWDGVTLAKLGPVKRGAGKDAENDFFWKYTPSGEAELSFSEGNPGPFKPGDYYYVDMERDPDAPWVLTELNQQDHAVTVVFHCPTDEIVGCSWASLKLGLSREATGAREELQPHASRWRIRFTFAEPSDAAPKVVAFQK